ncbi:hypothetical protein [Streptomyces sp. NPDC051218]
MQTSVDVVAIAYKGVGSMPTWLMIPVLILVVLGIVLGWRQKRNR